MKIEFSDDEIARIYALVEKAGDAQMRGSKPADRARIMVYRIIAVGLDALEAQK